jgi:hypothetical protein
MKEALALAAIYSLNPQWVLQVFQPCPAGQLKNYKTQETLSHFLLSPLPHSAFSKSFCPVNSKIKN